MIRPPVIAAALLLTACASAPRADELQGSAVLRENAVQFSDDAVKRSSVEALRTSLETSCDGACAIAYLDVELTEDLISARKLLEAADLLDPPARVILLPPALPPIEVARTTAPTCASHIEVGDSGVFAARDGEMLSADTRCERWDAVACRGSDKLYDWPRLRSLLGDVEEVCVSAPDSTSVATLERMHDALGRPVVIFAGELPRVNDISQEDIAEALRIRKRDLQWCYEAESGEAIQPESFKFRLLVAPDGSVERVAILDGIRTTAQFEACVESLGETLQFDRDSGAPPIVVEYPVEFP